MIARGESDPPRPGVDPTGLRPILLDLCASCASQTTSCAHPSLTCEEPIGNLRRTETYLRITALLLHGAFIYLRWQGSLSIAMPYESKLSIPISELMTHARRTALYVRKYAARLSAASEKRIGSGTALQLQRLVDDFDRINSEMERRAIGSSEDRVRAVAELETTIVMAARLASKAHPDIGENLKRLRNSSKRRRSAGYVNRSLVQYLLLFEEHKKVLGRLLPKTIVSDGERAIAALTKHIEAIDKRRDRVRAASQQRAAILREIRTIVGEVRELAAVLFRYEPEIAQLFQMPKRRSVRSSRKPRVEPPAPA